LLFKLSNLNSNFELTLGYLNPALNNSVNLYPVISVCETNLVIHWIESYLVDRVIRLSNH